MKEHAQTAKDIVERLRAADAEEFAVLERSLAADTRKTVRNAVETARRRLDNERHEAERVDAMYVFQDELAEGAVAMGLDEVGRGPLAGPLAVGAVVLPQEPRIMRLNDSKQLTTAAREEIAGEIRQTAIAWTVQYIDARAIDENGMTASLKAAFKRAIDAIDAAVPGVGAVLIDGNPLRIDPRERSLVKGDARCASIAAASIVAKTARDALMDEYAERYPGYGFERNKGYGSKEHMDAIKTRGMCAIHRRTFCGGIAQETLF